MRILLWVALLALTGARAASAMTLSSHDLTQGAAIPAAHIYPRCGGQNISPELAWRDVPAAAKSLVLTMIDMDVKPALWSHWVVVDLSPSTSGLPRGVKTLPGGAHAVVSNFGEAAYDGPCPPAGSGLHHYQLTIWALPSATFAAGADQHADDLLAKLTAASIAHASLTATATAK